jgi:hypothetical protein
MSCIEIYLYDVDHKDECKLAIRLYPERLLIPTESGCEWTWQRTDSKYYYVKDHLGNIRVTLQQNGNLASARDYYPYGETLRAYTTAGVGDRYMFTEKERDVETNLDYFACPDTKI